jgi:hypothetical protein
MFEYIELISTHSIKDAPVADSAEPFSVLIFSSGHTGLLSQNTILFEDLASHGYIVRSVGHPYESLLVEYPDQRPIEYSRQRSTFFSRQSKASDILQKVQTRNTQPVR